MLSTVDQGTFQTQECNSTRWTRVLRLRKKQQWVIKGFTFSHWHQCTGCLLHQWPLKGALWGWAMSTSHTNWLWIYLTSGLFQWSNHCAKTPRNFTKAVRAHCSPGMRFPFRVLSNTCLFTELEERRYWSDNSLWGSLRGQRRWNQLAKAWGCPHHYWLHPQAELGVSFH